MTKDVRKRQESRPWQGRLGLVVLVLAYAVSVVWIVRVAREQSDRPDDDRQIIRVVHSQAERAVQEAFARLVHEYETLHPDVRIIVQCIPARAYKQWVTTQCIGDMVPDIIESESRWDEMWVQIASRYLRPITEYVGRPNPYNAGTELAGVPWRDTFTDGMTGGYWPHLMEFYSVPMALQTVRIFYNKDLVEQVTGSPAPPTSFSEWMELCQRIRAYAEKTGQTIFPIASFMNTASSILDAMYLGYFPALTGGLMDPYDAGYWGMGNDPTPMMLALATESFTLKHPRIAAALALLREIAQYYQPSFISDDAAQVRGLFTQGRAAMLVGNSREARALDDATNFEVGVFDFPLPRPDHPRYGQHAGASFAEEPLGAFTFALSKNSRHPDRAVDFLMFCTARENNEAFCRTMHWFPIIVGAEPLDYIKVFAPHIEGASRYPALTQRGGTTQLWFAQHYPLYLNGKMTFEELMTQLEEVWRKEGAEDFVRRDTLYRRALVKGEANVARMRARLLFAEAGAVKPGQIWGDRTTYQLGMEQVNLLENGVAGRTYIWHHLQQGDYPFP